MIELGFKTSNIQDLLNEVDKIKSSTLDLYVANPITFQEKFKSLRLHILSKYQIISIEQLALLKNSKSQVNGIRIELKSLKTIKESYNIKFIYQKDCNSEKQTFSRKTSLIELEDSFAASFYLPQRDKALETAYSKPGVELLQNLFSATLGFNKGQYLSRSKESKKSQNIETTSYKHIIGNTIAENKFLFSNFNSDKIDISIRKHNPPKKFDILLPSLSFGSVKPAVSLVLEDLNDCIHSHTTILLRRNEDIPISVSAIVFYLMQNTDFLNILPVSPQILNTLSISRLLKIPIPFATNTKILNKVNTLLKEEITHYNRTKVIEEEIINLF